MAKDTSSQEYLELKVELRSLLISSQQGCNEHQLSKDYAAFNSANPIPYARLGYGSLIELLMSMPDVARIDNRFGTILIHGVPDTSTKHIKDFVMGQKKKTFKYPNQRGYGPPPRYRQVSLIVQIDPPHPEWETFMARSDLLSVRFSHGNLLTIFNRTIKYP